MAALRTFILFNKYITNQNHKGKGYTFKDFIIDCVQKMTEPDGDNVRKTAKMMKHYPP